VRQEFLSILEEEYFNLMSVFLKQVLQNILPGQDRLAFYELFNVSIYNFVTEELSVCNSEILFEKAVEVFRKDLASFFYCIVAICQTAE
jgi:hypothetical protein